MTASPILTAFPPRFIAWMPNTLAQEAPYPSQWGNPRNYSNDPRDPGGATMDGIIQVEYDTWRVQHGLPRQPVKLISQVEGDNIYYSCYWLPYCPELQVGLDGVFFDSDVNEGPRAAIMILQYALGIADDGLWGPKTDAAVKAIADVPAVIRAFGARRLAVYKETRNFTTFGADWTRRTSEITAAGLKDAAAANVVA